MFKKHLDDNNKIIVIKKTLIVEGRPRHGNDFGFIEVIDKSRFDEKSQTQIGIFTAISRGLINRKGDEIVWGGVVRESILIRKL